MQKEKSEIELETQLAIQQEKEQERLKDEEKKKTEEAENEKKAEEDEKRVEDDEKQRVEDDDKRKLEEAEKKAAEEHSKAAEETQPNAIEKVESQVEDVPQPTQDQEQHTPQQPQEPQVRTEQSNTSQPHQLQEQPPQQQEDKKPENPEVPVPQYQIEQQSVEQGRQLAIQQQERVSVPAPEAPQQQQVGEPAQELPSQQQDFDLTQSSEPSQHVQVPVAPAEHEAVHVSTLASVPADQAPQKTQDVPMEVDTQQTVEPQPDSEVKTFSVTDAPSQPQSSQSFAVNKNPSFESAQLSALSAQPTPQPAPEAPQIMFVNHHTTGNQSGPVDVSQMQPQVQSQGDASAMHMSQAQDGTFVKQEEDASQSTRPSFSIASESNSVDRVTSQLPHSIDNSQSQTTQNQGV